MHAACMMAAKMKAARHKAATGVVKPLAACGNLAAPPESTSNIGIMMPVIPTGMASVIQIMQAHTTTASTALPTGVSTVILPSMPAISGMGMTYRIKKNAVHAAMKPPRVFPGEPPARRTFSIRLPINPRPEAETASPSCCMVVIFITSLPWLCWNYFLSASAVRLTSNTPMTLPPSLTGAEICTVSMLVEGSGLDSSCCQTLPSFIEVSKFGLPLPM